MKAMPVRHPDEDVFEAYAFERLSEENLAEFEEHLLICPQCQDTLEQTEAYIRFMKAATSVYAGKLRVMPDRRRSGLRWNVAAAAILLLTCMTALFSWRNPAGAPKVVDLQAYRGAGGSPETTAPAGRSLDLRIDLREVRPAAGYRVEIVDATGRRVWFGGTPVRLAGGLPAGDYWVRLATDTGEPLREFALHTE